MDTFRKIALYVAGPLIGLFIAWNMVHIPPQIGLVMMTAAALFYPLMRWPVVGLFMIPVLETFTPWLRRMYYLVYSRPGVDPLIALGDIVLLFTLIGLFRAAGQRWSKMTPYQYIIIAYVLYVFVRSFVFCINPASRALAEFKYYGPPALLFIVGMIFADRSDIHRRIWTITILLGVAAAAYAFVQMLIGYSDAEKIWFSSIEFTTLMVNGTPRPFSFLQAPVALADLMVVASIAVLYVASRDVKLKILYLLLPIFLYALLVTSVRSNWIGVAVVMASWMLLAFVKNPAGRIASIVGMVILVLIFQAMQEVANSGTADPMAALTHAMPGSRYFNMFVTDRASAIYNPLGEHSFQYRMMLWTNLISYSFEPINFILGRGTGTLSADSLYITYLAEFGYPGLIFIAWLTLLFLHRSLVFSDSAADEESRRLARAMFALNAALAVMNITGTHIHYFPGDFYFWFFNGILTQWWLDKREMEKPA